MKLWYLATPYSKYPGGIGEAYAVALRACGALVKAKVPVFSPIAYTHPIAIECGLNPYDLSIWISADEPMMHVATGLIMLRATSWKVSEGMAIEHRAFVAAGKPVVWIDPYEVPDGLK